MNKILMTALFAGTMLISNDICADNSTNFQENVIDQQQQLHEGNQQQLITINTFDFHTDDSDESYFSDNSYSSDESYFSDNSYSSDESYFSDDSCYISEELDSDTYDVDEQNLITDYNNYLENELDNILENNIEELNDQSLELNDQSFNEYYGMLFENSNDEQFASRINRKTRLVGKKIKYQWKKGFRSIRNKTITTIANIKNGVHKSAEFTKNTFSAFMNDVKNNPAKYVGYGITILSGTIALISIINNNSSIEDINSTENSTEFNIDKGNSTEFNIDKGNSTEFNIDKGNSTEFNLDKENSPKPFSCEYFQKYISPNITCAEAEAMLKNSKELIELYKLIHRLR